MANGRVRIGFSKPYVALYKNTSGKLTYSNGMPLARGVDVSIEPDDTGDNDDFYADNVLAESRSHKKFTGATLTVTVDGLKPEAKALIQGLPEADSDGLVHYGDSQSIPYVGFGYVTEYLEDGEESFVPTILYKCNFNQIGDSAATDADTTTYTTEQLTGKILKSDNANHDWRADGNTSFATEAEAYAVVTKTLGTTAGA